MVEVESRRAGGGAPWNPPTVADTKRKFYEAFRKPVPGIYNNIIQELLVQQHLMRWNKKYTYDEVRCGFWWGSAWAPSGHGRGPVEVPRTLDYLPRLGTGRC